MYKEKKEAPEKNGPLRLSAEERLWRKEAACFMPESVIDQLIAECGNNIQKLILNSWRWIQECKETAFRHVSETSDGHDPLEYLCRSLHIPLAHADGIRQRDAEPMQKIVDVVNLYLTQKLGGLGLTVEPAGENRWRKEASVFIPDEVLDQMIEINGMDPQKFVLDSQRWLQEKKDAAYRQVSYNSGSQDVMSFLSQSLNIPVTYLESIRSRSSDQRQQVLDAIQYYLTEKLECLLLDSRNGISAAHPLQGPAKGKIVGSDNTMKPHSMSPLLSDRNKTDTPIKQIITPERVAPMNFEHVEIPPCAVGVQAPIKRFKLPRPAFQPTETFHEVLNCLKENYAVVHIFGMSGNGKSQIVRAVCDDMAADALIWHVQFADGVSLFAELKDLLHRLESLSASSREEIIRGMDAGNFRKLVSSLRNVGVPVLLVFEDIVGADKINVQNMIQDLLLEGESASRNGVQFLVATRRKDAIFSEDDLLALETYQTIKVRGFSCSEAEKFLSTGMQTTATDRQDITKLAEMLHYSPLRLTLAKAYCKKYRTSYKHYYESLGRNQKIIDKEKEMLEQDQGIAKYHGYEVIMKSLRLDVCTGLENEEFLQCNVIRMMSFVSNEDIPDVLIGRFFQVAKNMEKAEERNQVNFLLTRLETDCDMTIHELGAPLEYGRILSSIHMDILHAVQMSMSMDERRETAVKVLHALIPLVKKDNRCHADSNLLFQLMRHIERVVALSSELVKAKFSVKKPKREDFEIQMCLSRLYEVLGFVTTEYATSQDALFGKALSWLWDIACSYSGLLHRSEGGRKKDLLDYEEGKDASRTAEKAYKQIKLASEKIPDTFVTRHYKEFSVMSKAALEEMETALGPRSKIPWDELHEHLAEHGAITERHTLLLQQHQMLLTPKQLRKVFLCERICFVAHSRGRQGIKSENEAQSKVYRWYAEVGLKLTQALSKDTGVKITLEYMIAANNILPHMLVDQENEADEDFVRRLETVKKMAEDLKTTTGNFYEHGIRKTMSGTPYSILNAMKYIIKANTRYYKRPHLIPPETAAPLKACDEFFHLAKDTAAMFVVASCCMIIAGKYYAACGEYEKALEAMEAGFDHNGHGINALVQSRPREYAWAVYETGRAIAAGGTALPGGARYKRKFLGRYSQLLHAKIPEDLRMRLDDCKSKLDAMVFP